MANAISKLMAFKMPPKSNPLDLFTTVEENQNDSKSATNPIAQSTLISSKSFLCAIPKEAYKGIITILQIQKDTRQTVEDIETGMEFLYQNGMNSSNKPADCKVVLSTFTGAQVWVNG
jgi:hypothetical protein